MYISATNNMNRNSNINQNQVKQGNYPQNGRNAPNYISTRSNFRSQGALLREKYKKTTLVYLLIAAFCVVFCLIYEQFSYGEHADCMRLMFLMPLLGGALPSGMMAYSRTRRKGSRVAYNLWNSGIAVLASGCLIKGIIEISGRTSDYDMFYWVGGIALLLAAVIASMRNS